MADKAEFERLLDVYGFRCERFGQDLSTHARTQVVSAFYALASAPVAPLSAAAQASQNGCRCVRFGRGNPHWPCPLHPSAPVAMSETERHAITGLIAVARAAFNVADNAEDDGDQIRVGRADADTLSTALDALDELPDDQPGYSMGPSNRAEWALRRLLSEASAPVAVCPICECPGGRHSGGVLCEQASAPVAGEAVAYAIHNVDLKGHVRVYAVKPWEGPESMQDDAGWGDRWAGNRPLVYGDAAPQASEAVRDALAVWYGSMPESNGKSNWTAILHRKSDKPFDGPHITIERSEYPDRVRYEADRVRYIIGELDKEPFVLDYDADKCDAQPQADKDGCTCPSGDGSLRHPCPMHPGADKDGGQQRTCTCHPDDRPAGDCQQQYAATDCQQRAKDTFPEHPLPVFSEGKWTWGETGQAFSHTEMDEAAFVVYRAALSATQTEQGGAKL